MAKIKTERKKLLQLFFHPLYETSEGCPILFLSPDAKSQPLVLTFAESFIQYFSKHGFDSIDLNYTSFEDVTSSSILHTYSASGEWLSAYKQLVFSRFFVGKYYGLSEAPFSSIEHIIGQVHTVEKELQLLHPEQHLFFSEFVALSKREAYLRREAQRLETVLKNENTYRELLKGQDEALKISRFYHQEYEVLPLWYKRFGHILKWLMGKRSFKSLFNDSMTAS